MPVEAPPAPPPAAPAAPPPSSPKGPSHSAAFDSLERLAKPVESEPATIPKSPAQKALDTARENDPTKPQPPKTETPPAPKPDDPPKPPDEAAPKPGEQPGARAKKPADFLREKLTSVETERNTLKAENERLKAESTKENPDIKKLTEQLETERKARIELEQEMRFTNYERSPEYKEKYQQPYDEAWNAGRETVSKLKWTDAEGNAQPATTQHFDALMQQYFADPDKAAETVAQLFGPKAAFITPHMAEVAKAARAAQAAIETYRKNGSEREKQGAELRSNFLKTVHSEWSERQKPDFIPEKYRPMLTPKEGDDEGNRLLENGYKKFDEVMRQDARTPGLTKEKRQEILDASAAQRHLAANARRLMHWNQIKDAKIAELEKALADYQKSEPGAGDGGGEKTEPTGSAMDGAFRNLEKKAKPVQWFG